jgi:hypothetical protein
VTLARLNGIPTLAHGNEENEEILKLSELSLNYRLNFN